MASPKRQIRVRVERLHVHFQTQDLHAKGHVRNISFGGMFIRAEELPPVGSPIAIAIDTPGGGRIHVGGRVRWSTAQLDRAIGEDSGFGVEIEKEIEPFRKLVAALMPRDG